MEKKIKPLDLAYLIHHAFLSGAGMEEGFVSKDVHERYMKYDPTDLPYFKRLQALVSETYKDERAESPYTPLEYDGDGMAVTPHTVFQWVDPKGDEHTLNLDELGDVNYLFNGKPIYCSASDRLKNTRVKVKGADLPVATKMAVAVIMEMIKGRPGIPPRIPAAKSLYVNLALNIDTRRGFDALGLIVSDVRVLEADDDEEQPDSEISFGV